MIKKEYPAIWEEYYETVLENGLLIRVIPKKDFAQTYCFFATDYGSMDTSFVLDGVAMKTPDGVAHYLEHKMFDMPDGNAMQMFSKYGGSRNAFTSYAMTAYHVACTDHVKENLEILLKFVSTPYFTEESVEKERGIIAQEIRMYEDNPDSRLDENLFEAMYENHPIRVSIAGTVESIEDITAKTLYDCHRAFYDPSNMILCVVGPVEPEMIVEIATDILPEKSGISSLERDYGKTEPLDVKEKRVEQIMEVSMPSFSLGFKCNPPEEGAESFRMDLLADLAADLLMGESTALYNRLYEEGVIDSGFSAGYEAVKGISLLSVSGESNDPQKVLDAILQEVQRIAKEGTDETLFQQVKKSAFGRRVRELDGFANICYRMTQSYFEKIDYYQFPKVYQDITQKDVEAFIIRAVTPDNVTMSLILPKERI